MNSTRASSAIVITTFYPTWCLHFTGQMVSRGVPSARPEEPRYLLLGTWSLSPPPIVCCCFQLMHHFWAWRCALHAPLLLSVPKATDYSWRSHRDARHTGGTHLWSKHLEAEAGRLPELQNLNKEATGSLHYGTQMESKTLIDTPRSLGENLLLQTLLLYPWTNINLGTQEVRTKKVIWCYKGTP
jgi:hypothetical protein